MKIRVCLIFLVYRKITQSLHSCRSVISKISLLPQQSLLKNSPTSVEDWLQLINLHQYHDGLVAAGWDDLDYLDFTQDDLLDAGVHQKEHIELVCRSFINLSSKSGPPLPYALFRAIMIKRAGSDNFI